MRNHILKYFERIFAHNFIAIGYDGKTRLGFSANFFQHIVYPISPSTTDSGVIFEDKLKNMKGFVFKVTMIDQPPRVIRGYSRTLRRFTAFSVDLTVFGETAKKHNAKINIETYFDETFVSFVKKLNRLLKSGATDLTLNTVFSQNNEFPNDRFINTYDDNAYCALVPIPPRKSFLHYLLTPFDGYSWFFSIISVMSCAVLWHFLKKQVSAPYFVFAVIANFTGQSIPMNEKKSILTTLFQLCVLMTFIMGNAYQSLLITSMSTSREGTRLQSFDELMKSNLSVLADGVYAGKLRRSGEFESFMDRIVINKIELNFSSEVNFQLLKELNSAIVARCDMVDRMMFKDRRSTVSNYYYMIPEKVMPFYEQFRLADFSPFQKMIQTFYDRVFETGIRQFLNRHFFDSKNLAFDDRAEQSLKNEEYLLSFQDVYGVFYIALFGYILAFIVFLFEFFTKDFLIPYIEVYRQIQRKTRAKKRSRRMKVRRIQVRQKN